MAPQVRNPRPRPVKSINDSDALDGLPVTKWEQTRVTINQDVATDQADGNIQTTEQEDSAFPWPPHPLPTFAPQIPQWNQGMLGITRMGNTNAKLSIWDHKTQEWIPGIELERREAARKAQLEKAKHSSATNVDASNVDDEEDKNDEDNDDLMDVEGLAPDPKRRKATSGSNQRTFEIKKWVQVPAALAEKIPEPKYLADRRPGMPSLYKGAYRPNSAVETYGDIVAAAMSGGATGYDLSAVGGLEAARALLVPGSGSAALNTQPDGSSTPVRKNMPPRRKKKKLGGPGRKPKNPNPESATATSAAGNAALENVAAEDTAAASTVEGDVTMRNTPETAIEGADNTDGTPAIQSEANVQGADAEGSGLESEGEGSEEGEIASAIDPDLAEDTPVIDPTLTDNTSFIDPALTDNTMAMQITPSPVEDTAEPEEDGAPEEDKMEDTEEKVVAAANPADSPAKTKHEADADADADADAISTPVIEQEDKKEQEGGGDDEMDVLGAVEAAMNKEAGEEDA
ncbi:uncharacterized protein PV07_03348 [Cladophialophora immunda]|uniref:Uncharacterized protein n=1 Tax=Cladophialophora immunda TaxID=569365 RepID=A0A0D2CNY6_9EURO|nr:uncharacterized protein PV07_03348 [Cladophialophora immunda]KIW31750.1 hypothetical protein PV07_03348 [Cladophialophora immunda]